MAQWLRLHASSPGGEGSIPGQGTKILHAMKCGPKKEKNHFAVQKKLAQYCKSTLLH